MKLNTDWVEYLDDKPKAAERGYCDIMGRLFILLVEKGNRLNWFTKRLETLSIEEIIKAHHAAFDELSGSPPLVEYDATITRLVTEYVHGVLKVHPALERIAYSYAYSMRFSTPFFLRERGKIERSFRKVHDCFTKSLCEQAAADAHHSQHHASPLEQGNDRRGALAAEKE